MLDYLPKYYYKPILSKIEESYRLNAGQEYTPGLDVEANVRIVIDAENQDLADKARWGFVDINMWELVDEGK